MPAGLEQACFYRARGERGPGIDRFWLLTDSRFKFFSKIAIRAGYAKSKTTRTVSFATERIRAGQWTIEAKKAENGASPAMPTDFSAVRRMGQALQMAAHIGQAV